MKKLITTILWPAMAALLFACASVAPALPTPSPAPSATPTEQPTPTPVMVKREGKIGVTTVEQGNPALPYLGFWTFCDYAPDATMPAMISETCILPHASAVTVQLGWMARQTRLDENWQKMRWTMELDGQKVDLQDFEPFASEFIQHGENNKSLLYYIDLVNLAPGKHSLLVGWQSDSPVDDGMLTYQPGQYHHLIEFTVLEPETYPLLANNGQVGFQSFHSQASNLNLLLYLPANFTDPALADAKWPLILYLHGGGYRGVPTSLLQASPFPSEVAGMAGFPFMILAPVGEGGFEFWTKEALARDVMALVKETAQHYPVDEKRIYLMGDGLGAQGVWGLALQNPSTFAALVPVGGYASYPFKVPANICDLKDVPVWAFHGGKDVYVPQTVQQDLVDALSACGGVARLSVHEDMTINILNIVYRNKDVYQWLAERSR